MWRTRTATWDRRRLRDEEKPTEENTRARNAGIRRGAEFGQLDRRARTYLANNIYTYTSCISCNFDEEHVNLGIASGRPPPRGHHRTIVIIINDKYIRETCNTERPYGSPSPPFDCIDHPAIIIKTGRDRARSRRRTGKRANG